MKRRGVSRSIHALRERRLNFLGGQCTGGAPERVRMWRHVHPRPDLVRAFRQVTINLARHLGALRQHGDAGGSAVAEERSIGAVAPAHETGYVGRVANLGGTRVSESSALPFVTLNLLRTPGAHHRSDELRAITIKCATAQEEDDQ